MSAKGKESREFYEFYVATAIEKNVYSNNMTKNID